MNNAPWNVMDPYATPVPTPQLPSWAKTYRTILMVLGGVAFLAFLGIILSLSTPIDMYAKGGTTGLQTALMIALSLAIGSIPYLIANITYAILWATSLRGKGYSVSAISSVFLVAAPILVALSVAGSLALLYIPAAMMGSF